MVRRSSAAVLVALVVLAGCASVPTGGQVASGAPADTPTGGGGAGDRAPLVNDAPDYTALYERTIPSVVMIRVDTPSGVVEGSGFVYDTSGHLVTNQHVVDSAQSVDVRFRDGEWRQGDVVGSDAYADLAVVAVPDPPDYATPLPVADSSPEPGQAVVAIGSPFGLEGSITSGIVSGDNRTMPTANGFSIPDTVQTDAAINPGNSGGPLVSMDGTVVGVNRATEGVNVGFAISPEIVDRVVPALIARGHYDHPLVGILTLEVTPEIARANGLDQAGGLLVVGTPAGGPADGVLHASPSETTVDGRTIPTGGDVILAVDDRPIESSQDLSRYLALYARPDQQVTFTVVRNGTRQTVDLTLGRRPPT